MDQYCTPFPPLRDSHPEPEDILYLYFNCICKSGTWLPATDAEGRESGGPEFYRARSGDYRPSGTCYPGAGIGAYGFPAPVGDPVATRTLYFVSSFNLSP